MGSFAFMINYPLNVRVIKIALLDICILKVIQNNGTGYIYFMCQLPTTHYTINELKYIYPASWVYMNT